uniref:Lysophosphatidic acid phosphatase type 6-like n=1 Tax=Saccoglossus kowalevskii TaxID=10224 RepID=A0ABM0M654_SACKO|nr:PREDICTED: lysophosphatidic acid phosphatase type 6-like [Saccoglossus kowalevskii]
MISNNVGSDEQTYDSTDHLQQVHAQIFVRHGARTPIEIVPNVESATWDKDELFSGAENTYIKYKVKSINCGPAPFWTAEARYRGHVFKGGSFPGQLTAIGMQQMYQLGLKLRREYIVEKQFLSSNYNSSEIYIRSTNIARTLESARSCIAGMYQDLILKPPDEPVIIYTDEDATEILYPETRQCSHLQAYNKWLAKHLDIIPGLTKDRQTIQHVLGLGNEEDVHFYFIRDDIFTRMFHNLPIPEVLKPYLDIIEKRTLEIARVATMGITSDENIETLKMNVGPLVALIVQNLRDAALEKSAYKFHLYACHDSSVIALLYAFDIFDNQWPPFAADLRFEVLVSKMSTIATDEACHGGLCQDPLYKYEYKSQVKIAERSRPPFTSKCSLL